MAVVVNGCSLEGCHTNIFSLTDLAGINWRKYSSDAAHGIVNKQNVLRNPLDNPVLRSYSNLSQRGVLCAWRRAVRTTDTGMGRTSVSAAQLETSLTSELWVFWFENSDKNSGAQSLSGVVIPPAHIQECIAPELRDPEVGSWEQGMSYEVRTLLFRALHNSIERSLSREYVRIGRWFVQPRVVNFTDADSGEPESASQTKEAADKSQPFAISFNFFLHGESTVCVACEVRVAACCFRRISPRDLLAASRPDGFPTQPATEATAKVNSNCFSADKSRSQSRLPTCVLAPFGIVARLSGAAFARHTDAEQRHVAECWQRLLPMHAGVQIPPELPEFVEVVVRGRRMCYPTAFVLVYESIPAASSSNANVNANANSSPTFAAAVSARNQTETLFADVNDCSVDPSMRLVDVGSTTLVRQALRVGRRARNAHRQVAATSTDPVSITVKQDPDAVCPEISIDELIFPALKLIESAGCDCNQRSQASSNPNEFDVNDIIPFHKRRRKDNNNVDSRILSNNVDSETDYTVPNDSTASEKLPLATKSSTRRQERVTPARCVAMATQCRLESDADLDSSPIIVAPFSAEERHFVTVAQAQAQAHAQSRSQIASEESIGQIVKIDGASKLPRLPIMYLDAASERARDGLDDDDQLIVRDVLLAFNNSMACRLPSPQPVVKQLLSDDEEEEEEDAGRSSARPATHPALRGTGSKLSPAHSQVGVGVGTSLNSSSGSGHVAADQLSRMFPTPPSLDTHLIPSPSDLAALSNLEEDASTTLAAAPGSGLGLGLVPSTAGYSVTCVPTATIAAASSVAAASTCSADTSVSPSTKRRIDASMQTDAMATSLTSVAKQRKRENGSGRRSVDDRWSAYRLPTHSPAITFGKFTTLNNSNRDYRVTVPTPVDVTYQPSANVSTCVMSVVPLSLRTGMSMSMSMKLAKDMGRDGTPASAPSLMTPATNSTVLSETSPSPFAARTPKALQTFTNGANASSSSLQPLANGNLWTLHSVSNSNSSIMALATQGQDQGHCRSLVEPESSCSSSNNAMPLSLHSLVLNVALYDSLLNLFADRNFDACTICACNMNAKGNSAELELYLVSHSQLENDSDDGPAGSFPCLCAFSPVANRQRSLRNCNALFREDSVEPPGYTAYLSANRAAWHALLFDAAEYDALLSTFPHQSSSTPNSASAATATSTSTTSSHPHHLLHTSCTPFSLRLLMALLSGPGAIGSALAIARRTESDERFCLRVERVKRGYKSKSRFSLEQYDASAFARMLIDKVLDAAYTPISNGNSNSNDTQSQSAGNVGLPNATPLAGLLSESVDLLQSSSTLRLLPLDTSVNEAVKSEGDAEVNDKIAKNEMETSVDNTLLDWLFDTPVRPDNTYAVLACLNSLRPYLAEAVNPLPSRHLRLDTYDAPKKRAPAAGPLSWAEFHRLSSGTQTRPSTSGDQHDSQPGPQPIPPLLVTSSELRDWVTISPFSVRCWEQLHLQSYTQLNKDVLYVALLPPTATDDGVTRRNLTAYFDEFNQVYELCRLGKHQPLVLGMPHSDRSGFHSCSAPAEDGDKCRDGDLFLGFVEDYLGTVEPAELRNILRAYAKTLRSIADYLVDSRYLVQIEKAFNESLQVPLAPGYGSSRPHVATSVASDAAAIDGMPLGVDGRPLFATADASHKPSASAKQSSAGEQSQLIVESLHSEMQLPDSNLTPTVPGNQPFYPAYPTITSDGIVHIPALVIYLVDPALPLGTISRPRYLAGLMHIAQYALAHLRTVQKGASTGFANVLNELLRVDNIYFEVVGVEQLLCAAQGELSPAESCDRVRNEARRAAFSLYSRIATGISQLQVGMNHSRTLTGFGPAANREGSLKLLIQRFDRSLAESLLKDRFSVYSFRSAPDAYSVRVPFPFSIPASADAGADNIGVPSTCLLDLALPLVRIYTPPFVLGTERACQPPSNDPETSLAALADEQSVVLHCFYTVTLDDRFLLASVTDQFGELVELQVLNVGERSVVDGSRRGDKAPSAASASNVSIRRHALQRLWDYLLGIATQYARPIRFTIAKIGRVGHGELKGWVSILSRHNLQRTSQLLREACNLCQVQLNLIASSTSNPSGLGTQSSANSGNAAEASLSAPCVLSACLISLELDQCMRVLADCVQPTDDHGPAAVCPLSSPPDASCTHILTLPVSATAQPHAANAQDAFGGADNLTGGVGAAADADYNLIFGADADAMAFANDMGDMGDFADLFGAGGLSSLNIPGFSGPSGPGALTTPSHAGPISHTISTGPQPSLGITTPGLGHNAPPTQLLTPGAAAQADEHSAQCLQQPLSVGYYVSTAPAGPLPAAFRIAAANQIQQAPICFRATLHVHTASGAHSSAAVYDDPYYLGTLPRAAAAAAGGRTHQLDSALTCDVLRYVLESYNALSWLTIDPVRNDRRCCLPLTYLSLVNLLELFDTDSDADAEVNVNINASASAV